MDKTTGNTIIAACLALALIGLLISPAGAEIRHWESYTSFDEVTDMTLYQGGIWAATKGGLVRIETASASYTTYTNVDGLEMTRLYCLYVDGKDRLWVGGQGRLVNFSDPSHPDVYLFTDRDGGLVEIYDICGTPGGDSLWLANRLGVTIFLAPEDNGQGLILDTYTRLGEIERDTPTYRVTLDADSIWVGTEGGLAVGSRFDIRLLKGPTGWISYIPSQITDGPEDFIRGLVNFHDTIYIGTTAGPYRFDRSGVPTMTSLGLYGNPYVYNMSIIGDSILINSSRASVFYNGINFTGIPTEGMPIWNTTCGAIDADGGYWDGNLLYGIFYRQGAVMMPFDAGGSPHNDCRGIIAADGKIWGMFDNEALAYYEGGRWIAVPGVSGLFRALEVGPLGELWVSTHGNGVFRVLGDSVAHFLHYNSGLSAIANDTTAVVVPDVYSTGDAIWFANYRGQDGELVAVNPYNLEQWQSYPLIGGFSADRVVAVTAGQGVVYVGSEETGIFAVAYNGTPFFTGDDYRWKFTSANSGIGSDMVKCLTIDGFDSLWVGTSYGLSYQALGEIYFTNLTLPADFGPAVTGISFDGQGSLYAGSGRAMVIRDIGTGSFECLTTKNSGLIDDNIQSLYYQKDAEALWISTTGGISKLTMPYRLATRDMDNILAYPNPFVIRFGTETVRFNFAGLAQIRIYTAAGELVREIPVNGEWDGRNADGEYVASGLYLFVVTNSDDEVGRGKILLIRE